MGTANNWLHAEPYRQVWGAEEAFRSGQRAERARRDASSAQRSAAHSMDKSADSHERTAKAYEEAAKHSVLSKDEYLRHAVRHRDYAREDRRMAERLRRMSDSGWAGDADDADDADG